MAGSISLLTWLFRIVSAAFEATFAYIVALILGAFLIVNPVNWAVLFLVVLLGSAATARWEQYGRRRSSRPTQLLGLLVILLASKVQIAGEWMPWRGWGLLVESDRLQLVYVAFLVSLWCWWRGMGLLDRDHGMLVQVLRRYVVSVTIVACLATLLGVIGGSGLQQEPRLALVVVAMLGLGLISLVLARIIADGDIAQAGERWRAVRSGLMATLTILAVGIALLAFVSTPAADVLRAVLVVLVGLAALVLSPLIWLVFTLAEGFVQLLLMLVGRPQAPPVQTQPTPTAEEAVMSDQIIRIVAAIPVYIVALLPLVALVIAVLLFQRRRAAPLAVSEEEHESLFSWRGLGRDLRELFHRRAPEGLRGALKALLGNDPVIRIRRRYIQALLVGEARERARRPNQTPAEYGPILTEAIGGRPAAIQNLTAVYQRARYAPETATPADASAADAAWKQLDTKEIH